MSETLGDYALDPPFREAGGCSWHPARRGDGSGPALWVKRADDTRALAREARLAARVSEHTAAVLRPVDWVQDGDRCGLVMVAPEGEPLAAEGAVELAVALRVADALAGLDRALAYEGWTMAPRRQDLWVNAQGAWVVGLERAESVLAPDARQATRQWGALLAGLLGFSEKDPDLEARSSSVPPLVLDMLRAALAGRGYAHELIAELKPELEAPPPTPALRARRAASFGLLEVVRGPQGPLYVACSHEAGWLAIDPRLDTVVRLGADRELWATQAAEPLLLDPPPPLAVAAPEPPPRLSLRRRPEGAVLQLSDLALDTEAVVLVRRREPGPLLVPADGETLGTLEGADLDAPFVDAAGASGDRYAAFPLFADLPGPPARAKL